MQRKAGEEYWPTFQAANGGAEKLLTVFGESSHCDEGVVVSVLENGAFQI